MTAPDLAARAEIERLKKFEAEVIDETARFNRGWERRAEPYSNLEDEFEQMGWAWANVDRLAKLDVARACSHAFEANPGMFDSQHRYCTKCGVAE